MTTKMKEPMRSAFKQVQARRRALSDMDSKQSSKDKRRASKHDTKYPEGVASQIHLVHPVGVQSHVPLSDRDRWVS